MGWPATIDPSRFTKEVTMFRLPTMPRFLVGAALGLLLGGQAGQALAACTQADAAGNWQVYSSSAENGFSSVWSYCTLNIRPNGTFDTGGSSCTWMDGGTRRAWGLVRLVGAPGCIYNGYIYVNGIRNDVIRATLNRSKDHVSGVGRFPNGGFFFNMTRP
jgi:hypothetical protein